MRKLFVSFVGNRDRQHSHGWVVLDYNLPIDDALAVEDLSRRIEKARGYEPDSVVITSFQRLESSQS